MSKGLAKATIYGNITRDPELKTTNSGKGVVSFTIAVNRDKDNADFFDCVAWQKAAETIATYARKGTMILVDGNLQFRSWEKDGVSRKQVELVVSNFVFGGNYANKNEGQSQMRDNAPHDVSDEPIDLSDIPF